MGVCSSFGIGNAMFYLGALFLTLAGYTVSIIDYLVFLILDFVFASFGIYGVLFSCVTLILLSVILHFFRGKIKNIFSDPALAGIMLGTALTMTVLKTTDYFSIGAAGKTVIEMMKSYTSLGFHGNWRGVLYGTIVMVIMITFPRKFKKAAKTINPAFIALAATLLLNLWLIPGGTVRVIPEVGTPERSLPSFAEALQSGDLPVFSFLPIFISVLCGAALWLIGEYWQKSPEAEKKPFSEYLPAGIIMIISSAAVYAFSPDIRMPVASCAVVLIVGAWQSVEWGKLKKAFASPASAFVFFGVLLVTMLTNPAFGIIFAAAATALTAKRIEKE